MGQFSALLTAAMNTFLLSLLCLLGALAVLAEGVTVQDGDLSFPLESVKQLKDLQEEPKPQLVSHKRFAARLAQPVTPPLCRHPAFPEALKLVCKQPNAQEILRRLKAIAQDPNTCEICAYAACTGC
ncbi:guanylin [Arvicola amphibius]|uniref:guanylin n=1 Tax=Arvicola amphibius TaxID=1047088 RepID=UPI0018E3A26E|nr:guanylin [Arvicola amphibius]